MARDIDDVVGATHDEEIAVVVLEAGIGGFVVAGKFAEIGFGEALVLLDQLEQREEIFARSIAAIDLRLGDRVTFRLTDDGIQRRDAALRDRSGLAAPSGGGRT